MESSRGASAESGLRNPAVGPVETRVGTAARGVRGQARGAGEIDREDGARVLSGATGSGGAATPVGGPVGRGAPDDDAGAGGAGLDAAGVAAACRLCVAVPDGWVCAVELVGGALAVVAGAGVVVRTWVICATAGVTAVGAVVATLVTGAVACATTLVTGAVACATTAVVVATAGTTCVRVVAVLVAALTVVAMGAVGAVAVAVAVLTVLVTVLTVLVMGAVGAVGAAGEVVTAVEAGAAGVATGAGAELMLEVAEASGAAGLGVAAMARLGTAPTTASSAVAAANNRTR